MSKGLGGAPVSIKNRVPIKALHMSERMAKYESSNQAGSVESTSFLQFAAEYMTSSPVLLHNRSNRLIGPAMYLALDEPVGLSVPSLISLL